MQLACKVHYHHDTKDKVMTEYLYYILTVIGIGWFITESSLVKPFREGVSKLLTDLVNPTKWVVDKFDGVINCIYCCSFWAAIGVYFLSYSESEIVHCILSAFSVLGAIYIVKNMFSKH